jgi:hypothetical protein
MNMSKSEKSSYFRHIFTNNFFLVHFSKTFLKDSKQRKICFFDTHIEYFNKKIFLLLLALLKNGNPLLPYSPPCRIAASRPTPHLLPYCSTYHLLLFSHPSVTLLLNCSPCHLLLSFPTVQPLLLSFLSFCASSTLYFCHSPLLLLFSALLLLFCSNSVLLLPILPPFFNLQALLYCSIPDK